MKESDYDYDPSLDEIGEGIKKLEDTVTVIKRYEEIMKTQNIVKS